MISVLLPLLLAPVTTTDPQLARCADILRHHEGLSLVEYRCPAGFPTIGYGHRLDMGESIPHITMAGAEALLKFDIAKARDNARRIYSPIYDTLPIHAQDALIHMAYQMGGAGLSRFVNLKQAIFAHDWKLASAECLWSTQINHRTGEAIVIATKWAKQTPTRARFYASLFLSCLPAKQVQVGH